MFDWFRKKTASAPSSPLVVSDLQSLAKVMSIEDDQRVPRYPPFARGLPLVRTEQIMRSQLDLIAKSRELMHMEHRDFDRLILPVLGRLAEFAHLLPASEGHHHRGAGGLFRHSLEVGYFTLKRCTSFELATQGTPSEQRAAKPRWQAAAYLAGVLHDVGKPARDMLISDDSGKRQWKPFTETLFQWGSRERLERYFVAWRPGRHTRHEQFSGLVADRVLTEEVRAWLIETGPDALEVMLTTILGGEHNHSIVDAVREAEQDSITRDLPVSLKLGAEGSIGVPVETYVLDAMRRLVSEGTWVANRPGARIWVLEKGVFIVWKSAAEEVAKVLARDNVRGVPRHPDTLADMLIERGYAKAQGLPNGETHRYHEVSPDMLSAGHARRLRMHMLRITDPHTIFGEDNPPEPVAALTGPEIRAFEEGIAQSSAQQRTASVTENPAGPHSAHEGPQPEADPPGTDRADAEQARRSIQATPEDREPAPHPPTHDEDPEAATLAILRDEALAGKPAEAVPAEGSFAQYGAAGESLQAALGHIKRSSGRLVIPYPGGLGGGKHAAALAREFAEAGLIEPDPVMPQKKVQTLNGEKVVVLSQQAAYLVDSHILREDEGAPVPPSRRTSEDTRLATLVEKFLESLRESQAVGGQPPDPSAVLIIRHAELDAFAKQTGLSPMAIRLTIMNRKDARIAL
jgi:hypothetical protein